MCNFNSRLMLMVRHINPFKVYKATVRKERLKTIKLLNCRFRVKLFLRIAGREAQSVASLFSLLKLL